MPSRKKMENKDLERKRYNMLLIIINRQFHNTFAHFYRFLQEVNINDTHKNISNVIQSRPGTKTVFISTHVSF